MPDIGIPEKIFEALPLLMGRGRVFKEAATKVARGCTMVEAIRALGCVLPIRIYYESPVKHIYFDAENNRHYDEGSIHTYKNGIFIGSSNQDLCSIDKPGGIVGSPIETDKIIHYELVDDGTIVKRYPRV